jgi:hypothetical protein
MGGKVSAKIEELAGEHVLLVADSNYASGRYTVHRRGSLDECRRSARALGAVLGEVAEVEVVEPVATPRPAKGAVVVTPAARVLAAKFDIDPTTLEPGENGKVGVSEVRAARK